jgi:chromosome segregation ATPase
VTTRNNSFLAPTLLLLLNRENEITELDSTIHQLNETMQDKDKSISSLEENKSHFEAKINYLQKMVDFYVQNEEQYSTHINDLENRLSNLKGIYQRKDNEGRSLLESIEILEQRLKNSDQKFLALNDENTELRKHLKRRQNELDDASNDLKFLTLENQAVTAGMLNK